MKANHSSQTALSILIVGGGTAGWMAANLLAYRWKDKNIKIRLLESSDVATVGVGEGSTPQLKTFFEAIGVTEDEWMPQCHATYKAGIRFKNWSSRPGFKEYFHPFPAQTDDYSVPGFFHNSYMRRKGILVNGHPDNFFLATHLAAQHKAPIPANNFPFDVSYGYHFDSSLLGKFLAHHAKKTGVEHIDDKVERVCLSQDGDIAALQCKSGSEYAADIFLDCTGFRSMLSQQTLKVEFIPFSENLFNTSAVVLPTQAESHIAAQTVSTALNNGWAWSIPLTHRIGNGYVYSKHFCSKDEAETEFRRHLNILDDPTEARHIEMKVGRVARSWDKNCVSVGLSQGFIEPLEATALHIVQETVQGFIESFEKGDYSNKYQSEFNDSINMRIEAIRDYIVCHYRVNSRNDTEYWRANANNNRISPSLHKILHSWMSGKNLSDELARQKIEDYYPSVSWHCLLAGYGIYPSDEQCVEGNDFANKTNIPKTVDFIERCGLNFPNHGEYLQRQKVRP